MSNSVCPDQTAHYEPSHLGLRCFQKPIIIAFGSESVKFTLLRQYDFLFAVPSEKWTNSQRHIYLFSLAATVYIWCREWSFDFMRRAGRFVKTYPYNMVYNFVIKKIVARIHEILVNKHLPTPQQIKWSTPYFIQLGYCVYEQRNS